MGNPKHWALAGAIGSNVGKREASPKTQRREDSIVESKAARQISNPQRKMVEHGWADAKIQP
ncbi:MAG: hypothetical protein OHK0037_04450 [Elainellaceae cyanobacterium]